ncbi:MAG: 4Fe-4S binding protein [Candidatus Omnitrophica bacterium]|nr:4Fe-4S binding protein [Candidatus Omnitrophota bacterium]
MENRDKKRVVLTFPQQLLDKPIIYQLIKDFDLIVNLLKVKITPKEEGVMVLDLEGDQLNLEKGLKHLKKIGIQIESLIEDIKWDEDKCTHCTECVTICPTQAFGLDRKIMKLEFDKNKCIACGLCLNVCPYGAIQIVL